MRATKQFGWSKTELLKNIADKVYENLELVADREINYRSNDKNHCENGYFYLVFLIIVKFFSWKRCGTNHQQYLVIADNTC